MDIVGTPYVAPISPSLFGFYATVLVAIGLAFTAMFFVYQLSARGSKMIVAEAFLGLVASFFLGLGTFFLMLWSGIWV